MQTLLTFIGNPYRLTQKEIVDVEAAGRDLLTPIPDGRWRLSREHALCTPDAPSGDRISRLSRGTRDRHHENKMVLYS